MVINALMFFQFIHVIQSLFDFLSPMTPTLFLPVKLGEPAFMNRSSTKCQAGISTLRCLQSHFDGDWISEPSESVGAAYGHWPVSSQRVIHTTKPDVHRLSRHRTTMAQLWHFKSCWFVFVRLWQLSSCSLFSLNTPGLLLFLYCSCGQTYVQTADSLSFWQKEFSSSAAMWQRWQELGPVKLLQCSLIQFVLYRST